MTPLMVAAVASFAVGCVLLFIYAVCKASAEWQRAEAAWQEAEEQRRQAEEAWHQAEETWHQALEQWHQALEQWSQTLGGHDDETPPVPRD